MSSFLYRVGGLEEIGILIDGAAAGGKVAVLLVWIALGVGLIMAGAARQRRTAAVAS